MNVHLHRAGNEKVMAGFTKFEGQVTDSHLKLQNEGSLEGDVPFQLVPSGELTYPTFGKGKSSSKLTFQGIC